MATVGINYDEKDPATYEGAYTFIDGEKIVHNTGDPEADVGTILELLRKNGAGRILCSSSIDHFNMDGGDLGKYND